MRSLRLLLDNKLPHRKPYCWRRGIKPIEIQECDPLLAQIDLSKYNHGKSVGCFQVIGLELSDEIHMVVLMLEHLNPVGWKNVILDGEYVLDRQLVRA